MSHLENGDSNVNDIETSEESSLELEQHTTKTIVDHYEEKTAGFWIRFWAFAFDSLIVSAIVGILVKPIFHLFDWSLSESNWYAPMTIISAIFYYSYFVITTKIWQQTVGKMIFGIRVKQVNGDKLDWLTVLFREIIGRFICNTISIIYIMVAFMPRNNGLQDLIADTIVVHEKVYLKNKKEVIKKKAEGFESENSITPSV